MESTLPNELWMNIFKFADVETVKAAKTVCRLWNTILKSDYFEERIARYVSNMPITGRPHELAVAHRYLNLLDGPFYILDTNTQVRVVDGLFVRDALHGYLVHSTPNGLVYDRQEFVLGKRQGSHWQILQDNEGIHEDCRRLLQFYMNDQRQGPVELTQVDYFQDFDDRPIKYAVLKGHFYKGKRCGQWTYYREMLFPEELDDDRYFKTGAYSQGVKVGHWKYMLADGHLEVNYVDGRIDGQSHLIRWNTDDIPVNILTMNSVEAEAFVYELDDLTSDIDALFD